MYALAHTSMCMLTCTHMDVLTQKLSPMCAHLYMYCTCTHTCTHTCVYTPMNLYVHTLMSAHIHRLAHSHTSTPSYTTFIKHTLVFTCSTLCHSSSLWKFEMVIYNGNCFIFPMLLSLHFVQNETSGWKVTYCHELCPECPTELQDLYGSNPKDYFFVANSSSGTNV